MNAPEPITGIARGMLQQAERLLSQGMPHQTILMSFVGAAVAIAEWLSVQAFAIRIFKDAIKRLETPHD